MRSLLCTHQYLQETLQIRLFGFQKTTEKAISIQGLPQLASWKSYWSHHARKLSSLHCSNIVLEEHQGIRKFFSSEKSNISRTHSWMTWRFFIQGYAPDLYHVRSSGCNGCNARSGQAEHVKNLTHWKLNLTGIINLYILGRSVNWCKSCWFYFWGFQNWTGF